MLVSIEAMTRKKPPAFGAGVWVRAGCLEEGASSCQVGITGRGRR